MPGHPNMMPVHSIPGLGPMPVPMHPHLGHGTYMPHPPHAVPPPVGISNPLVEAMFRNHMASPPSELAQPPHRPAPSANPIFFRPSEAMATTPEAIHNQTPMSPSLQRAQPDTSVPPPPAASPSPMGGAGSSASTTSSSAISKTFTRKQTPPGIAITHKRVAYHSQDGIDARNPLGGLPPHMKRHLEAEPITLYPAEYTFGMGSLIAANAHFICYAVREKMIRVLHTASPLKELLKAHAKPITDLRFSPLAHGQGSLLASTGKDGLVIVWSLALAEDSKTIVFKTVASIDANPSLGGVDRFFERLSWHPTDPNIIAAAGREAPLVLFTLESASAPAGTVVADPRLGSRDVCFSPDGRMIAVGCNDLVRVFACSPQRVVQAVEWQAHDGQDVSFVSFISRENNGGNVIVSGGNTNSAVRVWDLSSGRCLQSIELASSSQTSLTAHMALDPTSSYLVIASTTQPRGFLLHLSPSALVDFLAEFEVASSILCFSVTRKSIEGNDGPIQMCCVQSKAVQRYSVDAQDCVPERASGDVPNDVWESDDNLDVAGARLLAPETYLNGESSIHTTPAVSLSPVPTHVHTDASRDRPVPSPASSSPAPVRAPSPITLSASTIPSPVPTRLAEVSSSPVAGSPAATHTPPLEAVRSPQVRPSTPVAVEAPAESPATTDEVAPKDTTPEPQATLAVPEKKKAIKPERSPKETHKATAEGVAVSPSADRVATTGTSPSPIDKEGKRRVKIKGETDGSPTARNARTKNKSKETSETAGSPATAPAQARASSTAAPASAPPPPSTSSGLQILPRPKQPSPTPASTTAFNVASAPFAPAPPGSPGSGLLTPASLAATATNDGSGTADVSEGNSKQNFKKLEHNLSVRMERSMQQGLEKMFARLEKERAEHERAEKERLERLLSTLTQTLASTVNTAVTAALAPVVQAQVERAVKKEVVGVVVPALERAIETAMSPLRKSVVQAVVTRTDATLKEALDRPSEAGSSRAAVPSGPVLTEAVQSGVQQAFVSCFQESLMPAFEGACQSMMRQLHTSLERGAKESVSQATQQVAQFVTRSGGSDPALTNQLRAAVQQLTEVSSTMQSTIIQTQSKLVDELMSSRTPTLTSSNSTVPAVSSISSLPRLSSSGSSGPLHSSGGSGASLFPQPPSFSTPPPSTTNTLPSALQHLASASSYPLPPPPPSLDPTREYLLQLISAEKYEEAFDYALSATDLVLLSWLIGRVDPHKVFAHSPIRLSQGVLLSLVQQLGFDLSHDTHVKLVWLHQSLMFLDSHHPMSQDHLPIILSKLQGNLDEHHVLAYGEDANTYRFIMHIIKSMAK
eukprot:TRINITY_DN7193_c0_g1_i3.p1 TRINITY_DN7193_c0_g1~~TRINITY_DN7193_c0_g1_i3.p1  ORF type:complete len:1368 (+),score=386.44 TRINITY_DN7193_c0_g1_i3:139-4104(+)